MSSVYICRGEHPVHHHFRSAVFGSGQAMRLFTSSHRHAAAAPVFEKKKNTQVKVRFSTSSLIVFLGGGLSFDLVSLRLQNTMAQFQTSSTMFQVSVTDRDTPCSTVTSPLIDTCGAVTAGSWKEKFVGSPKVQPVVQCQHSMFSPSRSRTGAFLVVQGNC